MARRVSSASIGGRWGSGVCMCKHRLDRVCSLTGGTPRGGRTRYTRFWCLRSFPARDYSGSGRWGTLPSVDGLE